MKFKSSYLSLIGIVLFIYIMSTANWKSILPQFLFMNLGFFLVAMLLIPVSMLFRCMRWRKFLSAIGADLPLRIIFPLWLKGLLLGAITPARIGEIYLRSRAVASMKGSNFGRSLSTVFMDRLLEIFTLLVLSMAGICLLAQIFSIQFTIILAFCLLIIAAILLLMKEGCMRFLLKPFFRFAIPEKLKNDARLTFLEFYSGLRRFGRKTVAYAMVPNLCAIFIEVLIYYLLAISLGIPMSFWYMAIVVPLLSIIILVPVSVSGIGTREAGYIFLFSLIGINTDKAILFSLMDFIFLNWIIMLPSALLYLKSGKQSTSALKNPSQA